LPPVIVILVGFRYPHIVELVIVLPNGRRQKTDAKFMSGLLCLRNRRVYQRSVRMYGLRSETSFKLGSAPSAD
jgi:hypothetical protein